MIDSEGGAFGFDCYLASPEFRVFQQPAKAQGRRALLQIALGLLSELALREVGDLRSSSPSSFCNVSASASRLHHWAVSIACLKPTLPAFVRPRGHAQTPARKPGAGGLGPNSMARKDPFEQVGLEARASSTSPHPAPSAVASGCRLSSLPGIRLR